MNNRRETVDQAARRLLPDGSTYDCALPLAFVRCIREVTGAEAGGAFVWLYDAEAPCFGRPFPLHSGAICTLQDFNARTGSAYPVPRFRDEGVGHE